MFFPFPHLTHIDPCLDAIKHCPEFVIKRDVQSGIVILNYNYVTADSFPDPMACADPAAAHRAALLRECRGIVFDLATGAVVVRPHSKFFNVNERIETQIGAIDWTQPHVVLEKLDGSMITAWRRRDGGYQWHTKMGATPVAAPVERFVAQSGAGYVALVEALYGACTPIFEWCSRQQRIVVDYPQEQLVLTAVRDLHAGTYASYPALQEYGRRFAVPVVAQAGSIGCIQQFLHEVGDLEGAEGYVVRFADGHAVKVKGDWYRRLHGIKELLTVEKHVWRLLLGNGLDDAKPFMQDADRRMIESFAEEFYHRLRATTERLVTKVTLDRQRFGDKKAFAQHGVITAPPHERGLLFRIWDGHDGWTEVVNYVAKNIGTQTQLDAIRPLVTGLSWSDFFVGM